MWFAVSQNDKKGSHLQTIHIFVHKLYQPGPCIFPKLHTFAKLDATAWVNQMPQTTCSSSCTQSVARLPEQKIACRFFFISLRKGDYLWCTALAAWTKMWSKMHNLPPNDYQVSHWLGGGRVLRFFFTLDLSTTIYLIDIFQRTWDIFMGIELKLLVENFDRNLRKKWSRINMPSLNF